MRPFFFSSVFGALYFLTLLFTESFYVLWFIPAFLILYSLATYYKLRTEKNAFSSLQLRIALFVLFWVIIILALTPLSRSIPLSIERWITLSLGILSFCFFLTTPVFHTTELQYFLKRVVCVNALFVPLSLFFLIFPQLSSFLPLGNVLTYIVGHNHAYFLFVMSFPFAVYFAMNEKKPFWVGISVLFAFGTLLTFSRFGLALLFLECVTFLFALRTRIPSAVGKVLLGCTVFIGVYGLVFLAFSLNARWSYGANCQLPFLQQQLCKNISVDSRPEYWRQAITSLSERGLLGNGGGTFELVSTLYRRTPSAYSQYPHNEYLQLISEYGVFGAVIILAYLAAVGWLLLSWKKQTAFTKVLIFSLCIASVDAMMNFNWSFSGLFLLVAVLFGVTLRSVTGRRGATATSPSLLGFYFTSVALVAIPLAILSGMFIYAELFYSRSAEQYFKTFPFVRKRAEEAFVISKSEDTKQEVVRWYQNDPSLSLSFIGMHIDPQKRMETTQYYIKLDPMNPLLHTRLMMFAVQANRPDTVIEHAQWLLNYYPASDRNLIADMDANYLAKLITYANNIARENPTSASKITALAYQFEPWQVNTLESVILKKPSEFSEEQVLTILEPLPPLQLWRYEALGDWLMAAMVGAVEKEDTQKIPRYVEYIRKHTTWEDYAIWGQLSAAFQRKFDNIFPGEVDYDTRKASLLSAWRESLETLKKFGTVGDTAEKWSEQITSFAD